MQSNWLLMNTCCKIILPKYVYDQIQEYYHMTFAIIHLEILAIAYESGRSHHEWYKYWLKPCIYVSCLETMLWIQ